MTLKNIFQDLSPNMCNPQHYIQSMAPRHLAEEAKILQGSRNFSVALHVDSLIPC